MPKNNLRNNDDATTSLTPTTSLQPNKTSNTVYEEKTAPKQYIDFMKDLSLCNISSKSLPMFQRLLNVSTPDQIKFVQKHKDCHIDNPSSDDIEKCAKAINKTYQTEIVYTAIQEVSIPGGLPSLQNISRDWVILHVLHDPINYLRTVGNMMVFRNNKTIFRSTVRNHCHRIVKDVKEGVEIYPKYLAIIYEDFLNSVVINTKNLFKFINVNISSPVEAYISKIASNDLSEKINKQKGLFMKEDVEWKTIVREECSTFYQLVNSNVHLPTKENDDVDQQSAESDI